MADRDLANALNSGTLSNIFLGGTNTGDKLLTQDEIDAKGFLKGDGSVPTDIIKFTPQDPVTVPYVESTSYYNNVTGTHDVKGKYSDVTLQIGREIHMEVINNSGLTIVNGKPVRHNGVSAGTPQIELAQADTFTNSIIMGVTTHDILNGQKGIITAFGIVDDVDTSLLPIGVPLYLSDTVAGGITADPPDIASQIGGALIQDASIGQLFVSIENNLQLPTILGIMQGQNSPVYPVTTTAQNILDYIVDTSFGVATDIVNGTINTPATGVWIGSFTAGLSFPSTSSTRTIYIEIYEVNSMTVIFPYPVNVPRDATEQGVNLTSEFSAIAGEVYAMRIRASTSISVTIENASMSIKSVRL